MKIKIILATIIMSTMLSSCKEDKKTEQTPESSVSAEKDNVFRVVFGFVAKEDDNFHVYYTEDGTINFTEESSVWAPVTGSNQIQELIFRLPEGVIPTNLRVDFGHGINSKQTDIVLKNFRMELNGKKFEAVGADIFKYFYPNEANALLDIESSTLRRLTPNDKTAPSLYPQTTLVDEIEKLQ